jgi:CBS domain-containing protein
MSTIPRPIEFSPTDEDFLSCGGGFEPVIVRYEPAALRRVANVPPKAGPLVRHRNCFSDLRQTLLESFMTLINAMSTDFPVIDPDSTLAAAARRFGETGCCSLAVVEQGLFVGALDSLDVAARAVSGELDPTRSSVRTLMRRTPLSCGPEVSLEEAQQLMLREREKTLFVTEPGPRLVGVIDLLGVMTAIAAASRAGPPAEWDQRVRGEAL